MSDAEGSYAPTVFLMSDGRPGDKWKTRLDELRQNNWFKKALKVALAIGKDADQDVLAEFTGNREAVITAHNPEALAQWIRFVSIRSSEIGSQSASAGNDGSGGPETKQERFIKELQASDISDIWNSKYSGW